MKKTEPTQHPRVDLDTTVGANVGGGRVHQRPCGCVEPHSTMYPSSTSMEFSGRTKNVIVIHVKPRI